VNLNALIERVERGDHATVAAALRADPSLATAKTDGDGDTLLHVACWQKRAAIVRELLTYPCDLDARGAYGRTPLHYAVHEGGRESVPIVQALLARGANPALTDNNNFTVAAWARIEMYGAELAEVLALLGTPPGAAPALDAAAELDAREPLVREARFSIGVPERGVAIAAYRGRYKSTGRWDTNIAVEVAVQRADGGTLCHSCFPGLGEEQLVRFNASLAAVHARQQAFATLSVPDAFGTRIDVRSTSSGFRAICAVAGPGLGLPLKLDVNLDAAAMTALVAQVTAVCAAIREWAAADAADASG
jgi:hypothetical protein